MIDLGDDVVVYVDYGNYRLYVVAYVDSEENHPVELARGSSGVAVLHKGHLIFQIRENKPRNGIARVVERQSTFVPKMGALHACRLTKFGVENHCKCHAVCYSHLSIPRRPTHRADEPDAAYICLYSSSSRA